MYKLVSAFVLMIVLLGGCSARRGGLDIHEFLYSFEDSIDRNYKKLDRN